MYIFPIWKVGNLVSENINRIKTVRCKYGAAINLRWEKWNMIRPIRSSLRGVRNNLYYYTYSYSLYARIFRWTSEYCRIESLCIFLIYFSYLYLFFLNFLNFYQLCHQGDRVFVAAVRSVNECCGPQRLYTAPPGGLDGEYRYRQDALRAGTLRAQCQPSGEWTLQSRVWKFSYRLKFLGSRKSGLII